MPGEREPAAVVYRVLLVDDDQDVREAVCGLLTIEGFLVDEADGAAAAVAQMARAVPDVVVSDWDLGQELSDLFLHRLAATRPSIGRVLLSGSPGQPWRALVDAGVVHAALTKPFERSDLVAAIHRAIASAASR